MAGGKGKAALSTQKRTGAMQPKKGLVGGGGRTVLGGAAGPMGIGKYGHLADGPPDLGVGNSSQHASQSQISEPESLGAVGGKSLQGVPKGGKSYCSPHSQRFQSKTKI